MCSVCKSLRNINQQIDNRIPVPNRKLSFSDWSWWGSKASHCLLRKSNKLLIWRKITWEHSLWGCCAYQYIWNIMKHSSASHNTNQNVSRLYLGYKSSWIRWGVSRSIRLETLTSKQTGENSLSLIGVMWEMCDHAHFEKQRKWKAIVYFTAMYFGSSTTF